MSEISIETAEGPEVTTVSGDGDRGPDFRVADLDLAAFAMGRGLAADDAMETDVAGANPDGLLRSYDGGATLSVERCRQGRR